ncbi:MAG: hypothetical protein EHM23_02930 [Acidobacteria bacterium]|nr:MAG: hypothetical protein EHM23_02930 [Acidobacteriota bacterium]
MRSASWRLGARGGQALAVVFKDSVLLTLFGVAIGLPIVFVATRLVERFCLVSGLSIRQRLVWQLLSWSESR